MSYLNIPTKQSGDFLTASEFNQLVASVQNLQRAFGWGTYFDTEFSQASPQEIDGDGTTFFSILNNAGDKIETFLPYEIPTLYNPTTNEIQANVEGATGTGYLSFTAKIDTANGFFEIGLDIGAPVGVIFRNTLTFPRGANVYHTFNIPINAYTLDAFVQNNARPCIRVENNDTVSIYGTTFFVNLQSRPL